MTGILVQPALNKKQCTHWKIKGLIYSLTLISTFIACINFHFLDAIDTVKEKATAKADLVKESLEKSKAFAGNVLNSTATLASQKLEKGTEFATTINQKVHQVIADKASLAGDVKDAVVAKSKAGAEAFGGFVTGMACW